VGSVVGRLEPLVCKEYVDKRPVFIPYHKGGKRLHIGFQEFSEDLSMKSKAFVQSIGSVGVSSPVLFHCCLIALLHRGHSDGEF
jgi:hypothetical protein